MSPYALAERPTCVCIVFALIVAATGCSSGDSASGPTGFDGADAGAPSASGGGLNVGGSVAGGVSGASGGASMGSGATGGTASGGASMGSGATGGTASGGVSSTTLSVGGSTASAGRSSLGGTSNAGGKATGVGGKATGVGGKVGAGGAGGGGGQSSSGGVPSTGGKVGAGGSVGGGGASSSGGSTIASGGAGGGTSSCPYQGHVTYTLAKAASPTPEQQTAYNRITAAMDTAVRYYNCYTNITKTLSVSYVPSVATADGNINGSIRFGSNASMNQVTAMHEISHTVGIGTASNWGTFVTGGKFTGKNALAQLLAIPNRLADTIGADTQHFWPYGLNYESEGQHESDLVGHYQMVVAIRKDLGL